MTSGIFTPRQREVLNALISGLSTRQTSFELGLAETNVKLHIHDMCKRAKVPNRAALVAWAILNNEFDHQKVLPLYMKEVA